MTRVIILARKRFVFRAIVDVRFQQLNVFSSSTTIPSRSLSCIEGRRNHDSYFNQSLNRVGADPVEKRFLIMQEQERVVVRSRSYQVSSIEIPLNLNYSLTTTINKNQHQLQP